MKKNLIAVGIVLALGLGPISQGVAATIPSTTKAQLKYLVEEEKLARDVYTTLYVKTGLRQFANINEAEQTHMDLVKGLLVTYGVKDPTVGREIGQFKNVELRKLYKKLIADGSTSLTAALAVGVAVEKADIADLKKMLKVSQPTDIKFVLDRLLAGSRKHLTAFTI